MSETAPEQHEKSTGQSRLDDWEKNTDPRKEWDEALYSNAGVEDFSDDAKKRLEEAAAYEEHMRQFSQEDLSTNPDTKYFDAVENGEQKDSVDIHIDESPELRRMNMMAMHIAELRNIPQTEQTERMIVDKENKLEELLLSYDFDKNDDGEAMFNRIADRTFNSGKRDNEEEYDYGEDDIDTSEEYWDARPEPETEESPVEYEEQSYEPENAYGRERDLADFFEREAESAIEQEELDDCSEILSSSKSLRDKIGDIGTLVVSGYDRITELKDYFHRTRLEIKNKRLERRINKLENSSNPLIRRYYERAIRITNLQIAWQERLISEHEEIRKKRRGKAGVQ